jgi:hypothetical protein
MNSIGTGFLFNRLTGMHLAYGLALVALVGGTYIALRRPCSQELVASRSPNHEKLARYYWEEASRLATDSSRHSALALQYGAKKASGPEADLWRALSEYSLLLAGYEISVAEVMTALAVIHVQIEHSPRPPGNQEGPP